jgi:hypothetical protein
MPFKTFTPGVLAASDVNTFLMQQAVITCTSTTRPASPVTGMTIFETDTEAYAYWTGSAWRYQGRYENYTPTVGGAWTLGNGEVIGRFCVIGKLVHLKGSIRVGSTTTVGASDNLLVSYPSGFSPSNAGTAGGVDSRRGQRGVATFLDVSTGNFIMGFTTPATPTFLVSYFFPGVAGVEPRQLNTTAFTAWTWAVDDELKWSMVYEAS